MWRWLFDRIRRKETRFVAPERNRSEKTSTTTVLYARVNLGRHSGRADLDAVTESLAATQQNTSIGGSDSSVADSSDLPLKHQDSTLAVRAKKRRNRIFRFIRHFEEMTPVQAKLLFAIHRRTVRGLAAESPVALQRDLQRFILSTRGQRISRGQAAPDLSQVRTWVEEARKRLPVC